MALERQNLDTKNPRNVYILCLDMPEFNYSTTVSTCESTKFCSNSRLRICPKCNLNITWRKPLETHLLHCEEAPSD